MIDGSEPNFAPISDTDWPAEIAAMRSGFAGALNVYRTMAHHPALLQSWADLREHVVNQTSLGPENSEIVILRTGARLGSAYEWQQHVVRARKIGIEDQRIARLNGPIDNIEGADRLFAQAVDELLDHRRLAQPTKERLCEYVGKHGLFDLIATVGFYSTLGFLLMTCDTPQDQNITDELAKAPLAG